MIGEGKTFRAFIGLIGLQHEYGPDPDGAHI